MKNTSKEQDVRLAYNLEVTYWIEYNIAKTAKARKDIFKDKIKPAQLRLKAARKLLNHSKEL